MQPKGHENSDFIKIIFLESFQRFVINKIVYTFLKLYSNFKLLFYNKDKSKVLCCNQFLSEFRDNLGLKFPSSSFFNS